ncbi:hypothetical protein PR048_002778 [Dryococelus australis]|uniref:Uncharacterized protein n=1 Tax=Dryococelus australis TaxID=614101 RepID=A0ABQ9ILB6_9NEOP|nr:hypothetical protein PR048_002778 [Dryococelus australis]
MRMTEVRMEQCRNAKAGKHASSGIVRPGIEPGSPWWEVSSLTIQPLRPPYDLKHTRASMLPPECVTSVQYEETTSYRNSLNKYTAGQIGITILTPLQLHVDTSIKAAHATVSERLACSPPTKTIRVQSPAGSLRIFARGNRVGRCRWSTGFLGCLQLPPPLHSGAGPYSSQTPSSALKTSPLPSLPLRLCPNSLREYLSPTLEITESALCCPQLGGENARGDDCRVVLAVSCWSGLLDSGITLFTRLDSATRRTPLGICESNRGPHSCSTMIVYLNFAAHSPWLKFSRVLINTRSEFLIMEACAW